VAARGRDAPIGGQAVLEGVMMRGVRTWSVAVRKPTPEQLEQEEREGPAAEGEIEVQTFPLTSALRRHRALRLPIVRGVVALGGSMAIGLRALGISANAQMPAAEDRRRRERGGFGSRRSRAACGPERSSWRSRSRSACSS
jgi:uncharacterized protein YqhQ